MGYRESPTCRPRMPWVSLSCPNPDLRPETQEAWVVGQEGTRI